MPSVIGDRPSHPIYGGLSGQVNDAPGSKNFTSRSRKTGPIQELATRLDGSRNLEHMSAVVENQLGTVRFGCSKGLAARLRARRATLKTHNFHLGRPDVVKRIEVDKNYFAT